MLPNVKLSGSTSRLVLGVARRVRVAREAPADELAIPSDGVRQVGVHDVETRSAANDVARSVVRGRDEIVARPGVVRVAARAALEEIGPPARRRAVVPAQPAENVGPRRSDEPVVAGRPGDHARAGRAGRERAG